MTHGSLEGNGNPRDVWPQCVVSRLLDQDPFVSWTIVPSVGLQQTHGSSVFNKTRNKLPIRSTCHLGL